MSTTVGLDSLVVPGAPICYGILMPGEDTEGGVPVVKVRDYDHSGIDVAQLLRAAPAIEAPYRRARIEPGDILMSIRGTTGVIVVVPPELVGANITQDTARIRVDAANREFLYQALRAPVVQRQIRLHTIGQAVKGINIGAVRQLEIPWPPEPVRASIARVLGDCDTQIRGVVRLIDAKRTFKRGLMQQLLTGQKRFPEFKDRPWVKHRIGDLFEEVERPVEWNDADEYRLVSIRRRSGGMFLREVKKGAEIKTKQMYIVRTWDIVISRMQVVHGAVAMVPPEFDGCNVSGTYLVLVPRSGAPIDPGFFDYLTQTPGMYHAAYTSSYGVHIEKMTFNPEWYLETPLLLPPTMNEQKRIAQVLDLCSSEIDLLTAQREQIENYRRALLSRLLSGSLTVSV